MLQTNTPLSVYLRPEYKAVIIPATNGVKEIFPDANEIEIHGQPHFVLKHHERETWLLRRMGYDVPAPILTQYNWAGGKPYDVQRKTCALLSMNKRAYVLNGLGTGKTKAALWAWDYLRGINLAKKLLVVAPLSTLSFTWLREVFDTVNHRKAVIVHGPKAKRLERLNDPDAEIFIINHDGLKVVLEEISQRTDIDALVIDELAVYRSGQAQRTKAMRNFAANINWVWGMTGSPIPHEPTDVWAQASIVTPNTVPKYFRQYQQQLMVKLGMFKWVPKPEAVDRAYQALQPAVRYTLDEVVELPESVEQFVDVDMGPKQVKVYKDLAKACYAAVQNGEITAANAGAVLMKLLQVSTGWVYGTDPQTNERKIVTLDGHQRIDAMIDAIESSDQKVLVFAPFKHALAGISEAITKEGIEHAVVSGDTSANDRAQIFNTFQNTSKFRVLAAHPQCLAHGITLTAASTIIWFAPVTSLEIYEQANHRIRRIGQHHKQLTIHLQATPVERKIYQLLATRQKVQDQLLELFEQASL